MKQPLSKGTVVVWRSPEGVGIAMEVLASATDIWGDHSYWVRPLSGRSCPDYGEGATLRPVLPDWDKRWVHHSSLEVWPKTTLL